MTFSWDDRKNIKNFEDHGIHFETAIHIFNDPYRIERPDISTNNNSLENRWQTIGKINEIIFVSYEERINDEIHIISARIATARERRIYNGYSNDEIEPWGSAY